MIFNFTLQTSVIAFRRIQYHFPPGLPIWAGPTSQCRQDGILRAEAVEARQGGPGAHRHGVGTGGHPGSPASREEQLGAQQGDHRPFGEVHLSIQVGLKGYFISISFYCYE